MLLEGSIPLEGVSSQFSSSHYSDKLLADHDVWPFVRPHDNVLVKALYFV